MTRISQAWYSAVAALAIGGLPIAATGQDNPFGLGGEPAAAAEDPFGGFEKQATAFDPAAAADPALGVDPAPIGEQALIVAAEGEAKREATQDFCRCVGDGNAPGVQKIRDVLRGPLEDAGIDFVDQPLEEVINILQEEYDIPIKLDVNALEELGLGADEQVTVNLRKISLEAALRLMLKPHNLTYIIQDEVLLITTPDEAEQQLRTCVYDVRDLDDMAKGGADNLIDTVVSCVATETWAENGGGEAQIRPLKPGLLVISQTQAVHEEIRDLLETIREMARPAGGANDAAAAAAPPAAAANRDQVVTRSYILQINLSAEANTISSQVRELITTSLPDEQWAGRLDDGQPVVLTVLPDRIVLRHRESVQNEVQTLLSDSGIAGPAPTFTGERGGGFGGGGGGFGWGGRGAEGGGGGFFNPKASMND